MRSCVFSFVLHEGCNSCDVFCDRRTLTVMLPLVTLNSLLPMSLCSLTATPYLVVVLFCLLLGACSWHRFVKSSWILSLNHWIFVCDTTFFLRKTISINTMWLVQIFCCLNYYILYSPSSHHVSVGAQRGLACTCPCYFPSPCLLFH